MLVLNLCASINFIMIINYIYVLLLRLLLIYYTKCIYITIDNT